MELTETTALREISAVEANAPDPVVRLGEWLVRRELISRRELYVALDMSFQCGIRVGDALVSLEVLQRQRVESEVSALRAALLPDGRVRTKTPPPIPADALREPEARGDTAVDFKVPREAVYEGDSALLDSDELLSPPRPSWSLSIPVEVPRIPAFEHEDYWD